MTAQIAKAIADETGVKLVRLRSGSLGEPGSGVDTYLTMVRANVLLIVEALR